jgi:hypothetical protein
MKTTFKGRSHVVFTHFLFLPEWNLDVVATILKYKKTADDPNSCNSL